MYFFLTLKTIIEYYLSASFYTTFFLFFQKVCINKDNGDFQLWSNLHIIVHVFQMQSHYRQFDHMTH